MTTSEQISELAAALSKAQAAMKGAVKDAENPHFRSRYADLASVREACWKALTDNGLSVVQSPRLVHGGDGAGWIVEVETRLLHASGQFIADVAATPIAKADAQGVGSATTYLRRYALAAFAGIAPEDDDGNAASAHHEQPRHYEMPEPRQPLNLAPRQPEPMREFGVVGIKAITQKTLSNGRTQWTVTFTDGVSATTISERVAMAASNAKDDAQLVRPSLEQKGRFTNLIGLSVAEPAPALLVDDNEPPPVNDDDIPF